MNIFFYFTCLRSGGVCLVHHLLAPRMERTNWGSYLFSLRGLCSRHLALNNVSSTYANTSFLQCDRTQNQITNRSETDWLLFCVCTENCGKFLTLYLTEPFWNQLNVSFLSEHTVLCHFHNMATERQNRRPVICHRECSTWRYGLQSYLCVLWML